MLILAQIVGGLLLLVAGGEIVVKGAVALANRMGISTVVIGLTVVAYGTSAPETVISIQAATEGYHDIAIGNVIGSNIANILLVIGSTALLWPMLTQKRLAKRDGTVMLGVALLFALLCHDSVIDLIDALVLVLAIVLYTLFAIYDARRGRQDRQLEEELKEETQVTLPMYLALAMLAGGIMLLVAGSDILIMGASALAHDFGVPEAVIGATIVAVGGSSPELVTSLMAAYRRHADIGIANVVGSNIYNATAVVGFAGIAAPMTVAPQFLTIDLGIMLVVTAAFFAVMLLRDRIGRIEGGLLVAAYIGYLIVQYRLSF